MKPTVRDCPQVATTITELYGTVLCSDSLPEHTDVTVMIDIKALQVVCHRHKDVARSTNTNLNQLLGAHYLSLTVPLRFDGTLNVDVMVLNCLCNKLPLDSVGAC